MYTHAIYFDIMAYKYMQYMYMHKHLCIYIYSMWSGLKENAVFL